MSTMASLLVKDAKDSSGDPNPPWLTISVHARKIVSWIVLIAIGASTAGSKSASHSACPEMVKNSSILSITRKLLFPLRQEVSSEGS